MKSIFDFDAVRLDESTGRLVLLDQTLLPGRMEYLYLSTKEEIWEAIYKLRVRGAPAIGVAAAYGVYVLMKDSMAEDEDGFLEEFRTIKQYLASARPTAVNLFWALDRMEACVLKQISENKAVERNLNTGKTASEAVEQIKEKLRKEAHEIRTEDEVVCKQIGEHSLTLLKPGMGILTHCNAGTIATSRYGTALAPIYLGQERGYEFKVYADETRPLLQGARLTAWELMEAGVDVTLICDNMAAIVMKNGWIQAVVTGCDRVAANGDSANKIGTSGVAILAKEYGIPFYIHAPISTIDIHCETGKDIQIEERPGEEIYELWYEKPMAPKGIKTYNPAFDVTDAQYITAIITEKGILKPPYRESISKIIENPAL